MGCLSIDSNYNRHTKGALQFTGTLSLKYQTSFVVNHSSRKSEFRTRLELPTYKCMVKTCIICGKMPVVKTMDHVLPEWLLRETGDPNRQVHLSTHYDPDEESVTDRRFAFSNFVFPACDSCNNEFGALESSVKPVVLSLLEGKPVDAIGMDSLLQWLDKIRIGLWLAELELGGNPLGINPNFHIRQRLGTSDRAVFIMRAINEEALTVIGTRTFCFAYMPSVFAIRINGLVLFNASSDFLFSKRMGFPYLENKKWNEETAPIWFGNMEPGSGVHKLPLIPFSFRLQATKFFQPMFTVTLERPQLRRLYENEFVRAASMDWLNGRGQVFFQHGNSIQIYAGQHSNIESYFYWDAAPVSPLKLQDTVLDWQVRLMQKDYPKRPGERRFSAGQLAAMQFNKTIIKNNKQKRRRNRS